MRRIPFRLQMHPSRLTKLHADVLVWILLPQLLITVRVAHEGENHILNNTLENKKRILNDKVLHVLSAVESHTYSQWL